MVLQLTSSFLDPDPALSGPPTQTVSGITNKAPVVDDPNIKLPTQEVKSLTATSVTDVINQTQSIPLTNQSQGTLSKLTPNVGSNIKVDGLGNDWTADKFQPSSIAGNTKYVNPKTGLIGSTSNITSGLTRTLSEDVKVDNSTVGPSAAKLNNIKSTMPKPNLPKPPNTPRIKTVKISRPNDTKGAQALLNLPKSPTL